MVRALINPDMVRWARERYHLTRAEAAPKTGTTAAILEDWEKGNKQPTFRQARRLAKAFRVSFGYLFLSFPPPDFHPLPDLRTKDGETPSFPSPDLLDTIHDAQRKQAWFVEDIASEHGGPLPFVGRFAVNDKAEDIAEDIAGTLGIGERMRDHTRSWEDFLTQFIRRAEDAGIVVLRSGVVGSNNNRKLDVDEFRGFVISDDTAPLVFINSQDAKSAQIFTLAHELAHIWVNESGVNNPDYRQGWDKQPNSIERLCNRVAAETLLPQGEFLSHWRDDEEVSQNVQTLARRFRVSVLTVLRQALDLGRLGQETYRKLLSDELGRQTRRAEGQSGDFYNTFLARNSRLFCESVVAAVSTERVGRIDAARLLNVKAQTIGKLASRLFGDSRPSA